MSRLTRVAIVPLAVFAFASGTPAQGGWLRQTPASAPSGRINQAVAYDASRQVVVLFGGVRGVPLADTWEWNGTVWTQRVPPVSPPPRALHAVAYDTSRQRVVLFGGDRRADTWEWDGSTWVLRTPAVSPQGRSSHAMAYDEAHQRVVLFGGWDGSAPLHDTWEWDGAAWIQRNPGSGPVGRTDHAMTFDASRQRAVLFGGLTPGGLAGDTWEWDGTTWLQRSPSMAPSPRTLHAMAYDSARQRVVLAGGWAGGAVPAIADTWEWDGVQWAQNPTAGPDFTLGSFAMAFDRSHGRMILACGAQPSIQTWGYPYSSPATYSVFGAACPGSAGAPTLQALGTSLPWLGERFGLLLNNVPAGRPIFVFVGGSRTTWYGQFPLPVDLTVAGMPGCSLLTTADVIALAQPIVNFVTWNLDICRCPELLGMPLFNQAFVFDPPANAMGMTSTNGGEGVVGIR